MERKRTEYKLITQGLLLIALLAGASGAFAIPVLHSFTLTTSVITTPPGIPAGTEFMGTFVIDHDPFPDPENVFPALLGVPIDTFHLEIGPLTWTQDDFIGPINRAFLDFDTGYVDHILVAARLGPRLLGIGPSAWAVLNIRNGNHIGGSSPAISVPEPDALALLGIGLLVLGFSRSIIKRRRSPKDLS